MKVLLFLALAGCTAETQQPLTFITPPYESIQWESFNTWRYLGPEDFYNNRSSTVYLGSPKASVGLKLVFSPACAHCTETILALLKNTDFQTAINSGKVFFRLDPVIFYFKVDQHILALCSNELGIVWEELQIFVKYPDLIEPLYNIKGATYYDDSLSFMKEIANTIKTSLESKKFESQEKSIVDRLLNKVSKEETYSDHNYSSLYFKRRDSITTKDNTLSVPQLFVFKNNQWIAKKPDPQTDGGDISNAILNAIKEPKNVL